VNLIELFEPSLRGRAASPALCFGETTLTFGDLDALSDSVAHALTERFGLTKGDRAAMYLGNCVELIVYYLACLKVGAIVVPINILYREGELAHMLTDAEPRVLLTDAERLGVLAGVRDRIDSLEHVILASGSEAGTIAFEQLVSAGGAKPESTNKVTGDDAALMLYTSGTTGRPKGAVLTHHNLASNIVALLHCWQWAEQDRFLLALPLFHIHGLCNGLHGALASGCMTFLMDRFQPHAAMNLLREQRCTLFFGVPTMYERLLQAAEQGRNVPDGMRLYVSGSGPLSPETFARFREVFGQEILERYGMSETGMITSNLYACPRGQGTVGKPLPGVSVRVVTDEGRLVEGDQAGEIQVRGPNVMKGYWRQPDKTADSFQDGWFRTGDLGRWDSLGRLIICGRAKELIISGGFNIYPQEVVNCLSAHPGVAEAAVVGVPDRVRGEMVKAYVVRRDADLTADSLIAHCRRHLASFKVPRSVAFVDSLPRNAMGKLQLDRLPDRDSL